MDSARFNWVPFYHEFAKKLQAYRLNRPALISMVQDVFLSIQTKLPTLEEDDHLDDIDPFTVMGLFNKTQMKDAKRIAILNEFAKRMQITAPVPSGFDGIPVLNPLNATYFLFRYERPEGMIDVLWDFFEIVLDYDREQSENKKAFFIERFNQVIKFKGCGNSKLTMALFWIDPNRYINLDSRNMWYIYESGKLPPYLVQSLPPHKGEKLTGEIYFDILEKVQEYLISGESELSDLKELSYEAWRYSEEVNEQNKKKKDRPVHYWIYAPGSSASRWAAFREKGIMGIGWPELGNLQDYPDQESMRKGIQEEAGKETSFKNDTLATWEFSREMQPGDIVYAKSGNTHVIGRGIVLSDYEYDPDGDPEYPNIRKVNWTHEGEWEQSGLPQKTLTDITASKDSVHKLEALFQEEETEETEVIPAAGDEWWPSPKEYHPGFTKEDWLKILRDPKMVGPVWGGVLAMFYDFGGAATCSQLAIRYGGTPYSISGRCSAFAKSVYQKTNCKISKRENGQNRYWTILFQGKSADKETPGVYVWKLRPELYDAIAESDILKYLPGKSPDGPDPYTKEDFLSDVYMDEETYSDIMGLLKTQKNIILQGAPGVGKTYAARRLAWAAMGVKDDSRIDFVQFHQNYSYEDFIMGYRPTEDTFELRYGIFYNFCLKAEKQPDQDFYFIIDEINRGNLSKIFGELMMLIEKDHREEKITLAYNGLPFAVPKNVYLIGMMNTADRSLAMVDYALRRRFGFVDMGPGFDSEGFRVYQATLGSEKLDRLIDTVKQLNAFIAADPSLGEGFRIGHSYFCGAEKCTDEWLKAVVNYSLIPLLREYWFDDPSHLKEWTVKLRDVIQ